MKLLYLGYFSSPEVFRLLDEAGLDPSVGRQRFEKALLNSLLSNEVIQSEDITIISYLPQNEKVTITPDEDCYLGKKISYVWTERTNLIHMVQASKKVASLVEKWFSKAEGDECIILTYAANPILLGGLRNRKKKRIKIVTICSEVPAFRNMTEGNSVINRLKKAVFTYFNRKMDGYVFMSKYMNDVCNKRNLPWIVVEGMADGEFKQRSSVKREHKAKVLFYAGGLHMENGIDVLLDAMDHLEDVELQLCGVGNALNMVKERESSRGNVHYLGSLPNEAILDLEQQADLLVNPRKRDLQLTKYSFPSKTFEYFSSGTPCIITRLDGIPDEYYQYCYTCDVSTPETLARDIRKVLALPENERKMKAESALAFIRDKKSPMAQSKKIVDFLQQLVSK